VVYLQLVSLMLPLGACEEFNYFVILSTIAAMQSITPHLFQISLGPVNCFVIDDGAAGLVLVDTGYKGSTNKIFHAIEKGGKSPQSISRIILTHTHPDHGGSAADIIQKTGAKLIAHPADAALLNRELPEGCRMCCRRVSSTGSFSICSSKKVPMLSRQRKSINA
jgi:hypothetical protein